MLYHLLSGRMPYAGQDDSLPPQTVLRMLLDGPPTPLRALDRTIPDELEAICEHAMARDPRQRYPDHARDGGDLRAFLEERVVRAHASGPSRGVQEVDPTQPSRGVARSHRVAARDRWPHDGRSLQARSNKRLTQAKQDVEARATTRSRPSKGSSARTRTSASPATRQTSRTQQARHSEYAANIAAASASLRLADAAEARRRLLLCEESRRGWEWQHLWLASDESVAKLGDGSSQPVALAWHPSGELLAATTSVSFLVSGPSGVAQESLTARWCARSRLQADCRVSLAFTPDGERLAWAHRDKTIHLSSIETGAEVGAFGEHRGAITDLAFSPDDHTAATSANDKLVRLWDVASGTCSTSSKATARPLHRSRSGAAERLLASASRDRTVRLWDTASGKLLRTLEGSEYPLVFVAFDPSGLRVAAGSQAFEGLATESVARGANRFGCGTSTRERCSACSPVRARNSTRARSALTAAGCAQLLARFGIVAVGPAQRPRPVPARHDLSLIDVAFAPDGARIATTSDDHSIRLWIRAEIRLQPARPRRASRVRALRPRWRALGDLLVRRDVARLEHPDWPARDGPARAPEQRPRCRHRCGRRARCQRGGGQDSPPVGAVERARARLHRDAASVDDGRDPEIGLRGVRSEGRTLAIAHRAGALELWDVERRSIVQDVDHACSG
jgi:hypothetical protein